MGKEVKPTEQFKWFCDECSYWISFFGLFEYRIDFASVKSKEGWLGQVKFNKDDNDKVAQIYLNTNWDNDLPIEFNIRKTAFHEVLEILFYPIRSNMSQNQADWQVHTVIRIFENTIFIDSFNQRFKKNAA